MPKGLESGYLPEIVARDDSEALTVSVQEGRSSSLLAQTMAVENGLPRLDTPKESDKLAATTKMV